MNEENKQKENEIDCEMVPYITCPWCGKEDYDSWEHDQSDEDVEEIECGYCEKTFWVKCMITVKYTSKKEPWK